MVMLLLTLTGNHLTATDWTTLDIATGHMKLSLEDSAIVARLTVCAPNRQPPDHNAAAGAPVLRP